MAGPLDAILGNFLTDARKKALASIVRSAKSTPVLCGLAGSSAALAIASLPKSKLPIFVIGNDADDAGYLYHDLSRLVGEENIAILPSGYKRSIRYGQIDGPAVILRTEALGRIASDPTLRYVISYPEALAEQVASKDELSQGTITLKVGQTYDFTQLQCRLRESGFVEQDYVYEPGHFAVRGSILDIFGYSSELPYRIDFFDDEVDSIRTFNIETQLSESKLDQVSITSDVESRTAGQSFLEFIDPSTLIVAREPDRTVERIRDIAAETMSDSRPHGR